MFSALLNICRARGQHNEADGERGYAADIWARDGTNIDQSEAILFCACLEKRKQHIEKA